MEQKTSLEPECPYTTYFDAFHCFYHEQPLGLSDYAAGLDRAEDVLNTLDSLRYVQQ